MKDFSLCIPTCFIVGKNSPERVGSEIAQRGSRRVLLLHDGGSYLQELLQSVHTSLVSEQLEVKEMERKVDLPTFSLIEEGVRFCHEHTIDFILAIGGGTVMDAAKGIAFMARNSGKITDYVHSGQSSPHCLPLGAIVTLSGTGSEVSSTAMLIDDSHTPAIKYPLMQESMRFAFSIMDPTLTYSLPLTHTLSGAFDSFTHVMERYFNGPSGYNLQDRLCEGAMNSILYNMREVKKNPFDYSTRAQLQFASTLANSTLLGLGCDSDWAVHYMENPITTETHQPHGATLAIITPAWMYYCYERDLPKAVSFAVNVMEVTKGSDDRETALAGITALLEFLQEVGLPTRLREIGIEPEHFEALSQRALTTSGKSYVGDISRLTADEVEAIYKIAY